MTNLLINHTNHPYAKWTSNQIEYTAQQYKEVIDEPFPKIDPTMTLKDVRALAQSYLSQVCSSFDFFHILIAGESTYVYNFVELATSLKISCICATTHRVIINHQDGTTTKKYKFVEYRKYADVT